jgi:mannitol-1-/sugar-/sorbitol-6-phosphatase
LSAQQLVDAALALLVDLDGTLVDSSGPVERVWTSFADRHGLDPAEVLRFAHGRPSRETVRLLAPDADPEVEARIVEEGEVGDPEGVIALPGAAALLASGRQLAIVTSCSTALAGVRLDAAGLPRPGEIISSDLVTRGKPDPECFLLGADRLGVGIGGCLVLEDAPAGLQAGADAGARVLALLTTHAASELTAAHALVRDLGELRWSQPTA